MGNASLVEIDKERQLAFERQIVTADDFINKNYLTQLSSREVAPLADCSTGNIRLYKFTRLTFDESENVNDKLISVYSALQESRAAVFIIIDSCAQGVDFYIGVRGESLQKANVSGNVFRKSLLGNFPGTEFKGLIGPQIREVMEHITGISENGMQARHVEAVTTIPSPRDADKNSFVQGMEKLIDTMAGDTYTALILAAPVDKDTLEQMKRGYEELYSTLSAYAGQSLAYGENDSESVSQGMFENLSRSINNSVTNTTGRNVGSSSSDSRGGSYGHNFGTPGFGTNSGRSHSRTQGYSSGASWSRSVAEGETNTDTSGTSTTSTSTRGSSKTLTVNFENKSIKNLMEKVEQNLTRINDCESFGLWQCAAYFISPDVQNAVVAANAYRALMAGETSFAEATHINQWSTAEKQNTTQVLRYLYGCQHPQIIIPGDSYLEEQLVTPANLISGREMPILMGLPQRSVTGLTVLHKAGFGRNIFENASQREKKKIQIGRILHMGVLEPTPVRLTLDSFTSHCFITGSTGSGKSNTTYKLLEQFYHNDVKFLVIEPAKGEYRREFARVPGINIFCTNPAYFRMLKINPFYFPEGIHVLEHLDRLIGIFNACWEMSAAMPAVLKDAIEQAYMQTGWDLQNSMYIGEGPVQYPTFANVLQTLPVVISNSAYSAEVKGNYTGSLVTRVKSLTNGISGQIFGSAKGIADEVLFDQNTIIDLSRVGSAETKSLVMGIMILKLNEYRMAGAVQTNRGLHHVTVMEEAHNLLRRCDGQADPLQAKSVEMISNSIAEMRTYGEGFLIVDQSPGAVDVSAIKNTNTKIIMRLPDFDDCIAVGKAAALSDEQISEISRLGTGEAVITQNNWLESVLSKIDVYTETAFQGTDSITEPTALKQLKGQLLEIFFRQKKEKVYAVSEIVDCIRKAGLNRHKQAELLDYWTDFYTQAPFSALATEQMLVTVLACENIFDICPLPQLSEPETVEQRKAPWIWYRRFEKMLGNYVDLEDNSFGVPSKIINYLMTYRIDRMKDKNCLAVRNQLYK